MSLVGMRWGVDVKGCEVWLFGFDLSVVVVGDVLFVCACSGYCFATCRGSDQWTTGGFD